MRIAMTGGTGFIGRALVDALAARGDAVALLERSPEGWVAALDGADVVVNLAGENIAAGRWTAERKLLLAKSRLDSTRLLVAAISRCARRPKTLLNASAVGYYGDAAEDACAESAPQGRGFLAALCGQWEREAFAAEPLGLRVATLRLAVVLEKDGGALAKMLPPFKFFLGGRLGPGTQPFPWIHRDDAVGGMLFLLAHPELSGPVNFASPDAKTNTEFSAALGRALHRPAWLPAPAFALKLALGEMADVLLGGARAEPKKLLEAGYRFRHPSLDAALTAILR